MAKRLNYSIAKFSNETWNTENFLLALENSSYSDEKGYGILEYDIEENIIIATLLKRTSTFVNDYNYLSKEFEKKNISIFNEIRFHVDFDYGLLYSEGAQNNLIQVKSLFSNTVYRKLELIPTDITPYNVFKKFKSKRQKYEIDEICIDKFNYLNGAIGKFSAKTINSEIVKDLVLEYKEDCCKIVFTISTTVIGSFKVCIYKSGGISLFSETNNLISNFEYLKKIIF